MNSNKSKSYLKFLFIFSASIYFIFLGILITAKSINNQYIKIHGVYSNSGNPNQTRNLLKKLNNDKYSLIFGSSRIQQLSSSIIKEKLLNINYIYSRPDIIFDFLKRMDDVYWENTNKVFISLDFHALSKDRHYVDVDEIFNAKPKFNFLLQTIKTASLSSLINSTKYLIEIITRDQKVIFDDYGVRITKKIIWSGRNPVRLKDDTSYNYELAKFILNIKQICDEKKKEVIFFTPVLSKEYFIQHEKFMEGFISSILKYIDEFYFFYYVNEISDFKEFFRDESHLNVDGMEKWFNLNWESYKISKDK